MCMCTLAKVGTAASMDKKRASLRRFDETQQCLNEAIANFKNASSEEDKNVYRRLIAQYGEILKNISSLVTQKTGSDTTTFTKPGWFDLHCFDETFSTRTHTLLFLHFPFSEDNQDAITCQTRTSLGLILWALCVWPQHAKFANKKPCLPAEALKKIVGFFREKNFNETNSVGATSFLDFRATNKFYADKTKFGEELLSFPRAMLLRPPRLGKTLFVNMLECLYDKRFERHFCYLFEGLDVAKNGKPIWANQFYVLKIELPIPQSRDPSQYSRDFNSCILRKITTFLAQHEQLAKDLYLHKYVASSHDLEEKFKCNYQRPLEIIANYLPNQLIVLVDEYDRGPMSELARAAQALVPLSGFLKTLKEFNSYFGTRYYITGIFTVPGLKESIANCNTNLTHHETFVEAFGFTMEDVKRGLRQIAGVTEKEEMDWAINFLHKNADGYRFFSAEQDLFNPQLVYLFFEQYKTYKISQSMILEDQNQHLTSNQLRIMNSSVELTQCMIKACIQNQPFKACIVSKVVDRFPAPTYMYQLGVLSLTKLNVEYTANRQFELRVLNVFTRRDYADVFLDNKIGCKCSCASFLAHPTALGGSIPGVGRSTCIPPLTPKNQGFLWPKGEKILRVLTHS